DVFHGWDFESALRRLLSQGWRDRGGKRLLGLEEMMEQLRRRRQQQLERFNLDGIFKDIEEKLDSVLRTERQGITERLEQASDDSSRRVLERVARKRRETLDGLPEEPAGAIRELQQYEFMDPRAEQAFQKLLEELKKGIVDTHFKEMSQRLQQMSGQDMSTLREMIHDLNALMRERLEGIPPEQLQNHYQAFLRKWGRMFPDAPATFEEFLEQLQRQLARMDSLMQSLSPEMRHQLGELMESVFGDAELQAELSQLAGALELVSPRQRLGNRYSFFGGEELPLDEAMDLMGRLQSMERLEQALRDAYRGRELDGESRDQLRELLGEDAAASHDQLQRMIRRLEESGLVQRDGRSLQLTARGMRRIGQKALGDLFSRLKRDRFGNHELRAEGQGGERSDDSKPYEFGDTFALDVEKTVMNALRREAAEVRHAPRGGGLKATPRLAAEDFEVYRSDATARSCTVLMLDMSRSMPLRGYFYAAKKVALALDSLIRSQYPRDTLHVIGFSDLAREISPSALPHLSVNEYVYGTNMQHGLMLARHLLARDPGENKQ
ncbi:MAG: VWA domain-containing protein, partial [Candidatus Dormibacteria bacterium]